MNTKQLAKSQDATYYATQDARMHGVDFTPLHIDSTDGSLYVKDGHDWVIQSTGYGSV